MNIEQLIQQRGRGRRYVANAVLQQAQKEAEEAAARKVMDVLKGMFGKFDDLVDGAVDLVRELRQQAKKQAAYTEKLARAVAFFNAEGNPLPVFKLIEGGLEEAKDFYRRTGLGDLPEADNAAWVVPSDWVEPAAPQS